MHQRVLLLLPLVLLVVPFLLWPAGWSLISSFTNYAPAQATVHSVGIRNYITALHDPETRAAFRNIVVITLLAVPSELSLGFAIAYLLRKQFLTRGFVRVCLLIPWLVSPVAAGVMWRFLFSSNVGLVNFWVARLRFPLLPSPLGLRGWTLLAVIMVEIWRKAPLASFLLLPGVQAIPEDLLEQATLDGGTLRTQLRHVMVPWLRPLALTITLLLVSDTLGTFDTVLTMTGGGPGSETITPSLYSYLQAFNAHNWPAGVTLAWLVTGAVLVAGVTYLILARPQDSEELS